MGRHTGTGERLGSAQSHTSKTHRCIPPPASLCLSQWPCLSLTLESSLSALCLSLTVFLCLSLSLAVYPEYLYEFCVSRCYIPTVVTSHCYIDNPLLVASPEQPPYCHALYTNQPPAKYHQGTVTMPTHHHDYTSPGLHIWPTLNFTSLPNLTQAVSTGTA